MAIPMTTDIEIEVRSETINSEFLIVPNALLRGEGVWRGLRLTERAMFGALLTLISSGWRTSRARIGAMASVVGSPGGARPDLATGRRGQAKPS